MTINTKDQYLSFWVSQIFRQKVRPCFCEKSLSPKHSLLGGTSLPYVKKSYGLLNDSISGMSFWGKIPRFYMWYLVLWHYKHELLYLTAQISHQPLGSKRNNDRRHQPNQAEITTAGGLQNQIIRLKRHKNTTLKGPLWTCTRCGGYLSSPSLAETPMGPSLRIKKRLDIEAAFIYDVAAVKKIDGVPPPRFNLFFSGFGTFSSWVTSFSSWVTVSDLVLISIHNVLNLPRFWSPPISFWSRFAGETNISTNPAWRHILSSSS